MELINVIREFVRNVVIYTVLAAFCMQLLPAEAYRKYARFAVGLVYICMMLDLAGKMGLVKI
ncbi:MAG: hypothetical protein IJ040_03060 [Lachnospiraceae bacterium]|nr:hypothetical protein [Lachnospiraceae bacterium]